MNQPEPLTEQQLDEIEARAAHLHEYGDPTDTRTAGWEELAGTDVPALLAEVRRLRAESERHTEDLASADNPTHLRWGLNDVLWGDDDTVTVLLSGPDLEPYWLELEPDRAAVLREDLAGPGGEPLPAEDFTGTQPCGHDDYHNPHPWADRPNVWCPGHSHADGQAATEEAAR